MRALAAIGLLMLMSACSLSAGAPLIKCVQDAECGGSQVCFLDGCGDPGTGIVAEVAVDQSIYLPQDIELGMVGGTVDLTVRGPLILTGSLQQTREMSVGGTTTDFMGSVSINLTGESALLPGIHRSYSYTAMMPAYQMFVGAGLYWVTARATNDPSLPYQTLKDQLLVEPGVLVGASFTFPARDQRLFFTGSLVKLKQTGGTPIKNTSPMQIQAFEGLNHRALTQQAVVSNTDDTFTLVLDKSALLLDSIVLVASPQLNTALVPTKTFVLAQVPVSSGSIGTFEMGDYGDELVNLKGTVLTSDGQPLAKATVSFEGKVGGDGILKSPNITTDAMGMFTVDLLATPANTSYTLTVQPPSDGKAGIVEVPVRAVIEGGMAKLVGPDNTATFRCADRLLASGTVLRPNGDPAFGVEVVATAVAQLDGRPLPSEVATTLTDDLGRYQLMLDQAKYRLDYKPGEMLPLKSRVVRIEPSVDADAGTLMNTVDLGSYQLSQPRPVRGTVRVTDTVMNPDAGLGDPAAYASVRFYRVTSVEGVKSSLLIGEATTDSLGNYSLSLPDHPEGTAAAPDGGM